MRLGEVKPSKIPRELKARFANLARRTRLGQLALRVLNPIVRPTGRRVESATEEEKAEYAASLAVVGAAEEAIGLFHTLDPKRNPEVLLHQAYAHFAQWDYAKAIPLLERYTTSPSLSEYWYLVGLGNLAAALVYERKAEAKDVLEKLLKLSDPAQHRIVHGYALNLTAENAIWERCWKDAKERLGVAEEYFKHADSLESLFIRKWQAVVHLYEDPSKKTAKQLSPILEEARKREHWETLRSVDYHCAVALKDRDLFLKLYFGTPYDSFLEKLAGDFGQTVEIPESYAWNLVPGDQKVFWFSFDSTTKRKNAIKEGSVLDRLMRALACDFYRPLRMAEIHTKLYPGEYFNPVSSPTRVAQLMNRIRRHWESTRVPMKILEAKGSYSLSCSRPCRVNLRSSRSGSEDWFALKQQALRLVLEGKPFDANGAAVVLKLPLWTTKRVLKTLFERGMVSREGKARATRYRFR